MLPNVSYAFPEGTYRFAPKGRPSAAWPRQFQVSAPFRVHVVRKAGRNGKRTLNGSSDCPAAGADAGTESPAGEEPTDCHFDGPGDAKQGVIASACPDQLNAYGQLPAGNRPATVVGGTRKFDAALLRKCLPAE